MSFMDHVQTEVELYQKANPDTESKVMEALKAVCQAFSDEGHSGMSAELSVALFRGALESCKHNDMACIDKFLERVAGKDTVYDGMLYPATLNLFKALEPFNLSEAEMTDLVSLFTTLIRRQPLTPLTGTDDEWVLVNDQDFQNKRVPSVFKNKDTGEAYYLNAIFFEDQNLMFTGNLGKIASRQYIKSFPFVPKTFFVNVVKMGDDYGIVDPDQLKSVTEYYKVPSPYFSEEILAALH